MTKRIAILGAGSGFTNEITKGLCACELLHDSTFVLMDIDERRLADAHDQVARALRAAAQDAHRLARQKAQVGQPGGPFRRMPGRADLLDGQRLARGGGGEAGGQRLGHVRSPPKRAIRMRMIRIQPLFKRTPGPAGFFCQARAGFSLSSQARPHGARPNT